MKTPQARVIIITQSVTMFGASGYFTVQEGERMCDMLCWEEMLGQIASMTHPEICKTRFRTTNADDIIASMESRFKQFGPKPLLLLPPMEQPK